MKKNNSLILGLLSFVLVLTSCGKNNKTEPDNTPSQKDLVAYEVLSAWTPKVTITHDPHLEHHFSDMTPLDPIAQDRLSSTMFDVPKASTLNMHFTEEAPEHLSTQNVVNNHHYFLEIKDPISGTFNAEPNLDTDGTRVALTFDKGFEYGRVYRITLNPDSYLQFENKDPSIQSMVVEMEDDPNEEETYNELTPKANIPELDLNNVTDEKVEEDKILSFMYSGSIPEFEKGDVFLVRSFTNDKLGMADFYGIFEYSEKVDDLTKIYYSEPSGEDIYDELRAKGVRPVDLAGAQVTATKEFIQDQFRFSDSARGLLSFFMNQTESLDKKQLGSIMEHLELGLVFNYHDNVATVTFSIGANDIKLKDNLFLSLLYTYNVTNYYNTDYDISLKKEWGIPVGVDYKIKCVQDSYESHSFLATVKYQRQQEPADPDEEDVKTTLIDELKKAKGSKDNFFKKIKDSAEACAQTEGNRTTIPIFKLPIELPGALVLEIRLDIIFDFTLQAMFCVRKETQSQNVVFNFASEDGGDTSTTKKIEGANNWDIYFMGMVEFKLTLRLSVALYFVGTYKFLHVEAFGECWIKVGLQGSLSASFDTTTDGSAFSGNLSIDFYVQFGVDVGVDIVVAVWHQNMSFTLFKTYILRIYMSNEVEHYADGVDDTIEMIGKTKDNINDHDILHFRVWDGCYMLMNEKKYNADDRQSIITLFGQEILGVNMFQFTPEDESLLQISQDGEITVPDGTEAEFTTHFTIHLSNAISAVHDKVITVHFSAPDAHHIYYQDNIDGTDKGTPVDGGRYRPTYKYTLPAPPDKGGYKFLSYEVNGVKYQPGDVIDMPETDLTIKINWHKIIYYQVMFYDGRGNIVYVDNHVEEFTKASEPTPEIRDQFMPGYKFVGWDKDFSSVTSNMIVRGIYVKVGD